MLVEGIVSVELGVIPLNQKMNLIQKIAALKPETASWWNLVDYSDHGFKSFHQVAVQLNANVTLGKA
jgi:hypothetical protein